MWTNRATIDTAGKTDRPTSLQSRTTINGTEAMKPYGFPGHYERRHAPRSCARGRILWTSLRQRDLHTGWMADRSLSGVSYMTDRTFEPRLGEDVQVIDPDSGTFETFRVARIDIRSGDKALVGCRRP